MANYIEQSQIHQLIEVRDAIFKERSKAWADTGIDLFDNDTLSSLSVYEVVTTYDPDFNINFSRNGEDAISNGVKIENKCNTIKPNKKGIIGLAAFQFHAMGDLEYPRYILAVRRKDNLQLVRLYDITAPANALAIQEHLLGLRTAWLARGAKDPSKMKYDVITLPESLLNSFTFRETKQVNNCVVYLG
jgi:hypothetical protein